jgi:hypothetical protein
VHDKAYANSSPGLTGLHEKPLKIEREERINHKTIKLMFTYIELLVVEVIKLNRIHNLLITLDATY